MICTLCIYRLQFVSVQKSTAFGVIFTMKLRQFVKLGEGANASRSEKQFKFEALIIKNDLLCLMGCISTAVLFMHYTFDSLKFVNYFDEFLC